MEYTTEEVLVERAKTDEAAFVELYNLYFPKMYGYIIKRTGQREIAEDIVSGVFIKIFTNLKTYTRQECAFSAWIYTVATNALVDHYRKAARHPEIMPEEMPEISDDRQDIKGMQEVEDDRRSVRLALKQLPVRYEQILNLKFFADLSNQEIAQSLGIKANNVGVLLYRALAKFEDVFQQYVHK